MSTIYVLVVFIGAVGSAPNLSTGLAFPSAEDCNTWRRQVAERTLRDMYKAKPGETIMSACIRVVDAPKLGPCPQEREC
jgi:hypothetical protein